MEHYKMYKAGKNWMVAGLMTTAALAGLTLANVNNTASANEVSANTNAAVAAVSAQPATSAQISAAQENVNANSTALTNANTALSDAQSAYNSASAVNENAAIIANDSAAVNSASTALSDAIKADQAARAKRDTAKTNYTSASNSASTAGITASAVQEKRDMASQQAASAASASAAMTSASAAIDAANATIKDLQQQINDNNDRYSAAYEKFVKAVGDEGRANEIIKETVKCPAEFQGSLNVLKQITAAYNSLVDSLGKSAINNDGVPTGAYVAWNKAWTAYDKAKSDVTFFNTDVKEYTDAADQGQKVLDNVANLKTAYDLALLESNTAKTNRVNAEVALKAAKDQLKNDRLEYNIPSQTDVNKASNAASVAEDSASNAKTEMLANPSWGAYSSASSANQSAQAKLNSANSAKPAADTALANAQQELTSAQRALAAVDQNDTSAVASAKAVVAEVQEKVDQAQATVGNLEGIITNTTSKVNNTNKTMKQLLSANNNALQKLVDAYNDAAAKAKTATQKYQALKKAHDDAKKPLATMKAALAVLNEAKANQATAEKNYNDSVAYLNSLLGQNNQTSADKYNSQLVSGGTSIYTLPANASQANRAAANGESNAVAAVTPAPTASQVAGGNQEIVDAISSVEWTNPAQVNTDIAKGVGTYTEGVTVNYKDGSKGSTSWILDVRAAGITPDQPSTPNQPSIDDTTTDTESPVKPDFTGQHGNNYYVAGHQVTKAQYEAYMANNKSQAANAAALPQTGNENSAAIVALGAVSAMFGLGLAAKKREF